jgi:hypothetical protein
MARVTKWMSYNRVTRDRIAARAAREYGLSRRSAREMVNRGTYKPLTRDTSARVPRDVIRHPVKYPVYRAREIIQGGNRDFNMDRLRNDAMRNIENQLGYLAGFPRAFGGIYGGTSDTSFNRFTVVDAIGRASPAALTVMASASGDTLRNWAHAQNAGDARRVMRNLSNADLGWFDSDGHWHNIMWYH